MKRFKKALAIICAGAMAFTAMPLQVLAMPWGTAAAIDIALSGVPRRVPGRTVFFEPSSPGGTHGGVLGSDMIRNPFIPDSYFTGAGDYAAGTTANQPPNPATPRHALPGAGFVTASGWLNVDGVRTLHSPNNLRVLEGVPGTAGIGSIHADADFFAVAPYLQIAIPRAHAVDRLTGFDSAGVDLVLDNAVWAYNLMNNAPGRSSRPGSVAYHATDHTYNWDNRTLLAGGLLANGTSYREGPGFGNLNRTWWRVYGAPATGANGFNNVNNHPFSIAFPEANSSVAHLFIHDLGRVVSDTETWWNNFGPARPSQPTPDQDHACTWLCSYDLLNVLSGQFEAL